MSASPLVTRWTPQARVASRKYGIPVADLLADIEVESSGREGETSSANAGGLTQFIPGTAKEYGVDVRPGHSWSQIEGQAHYLHDLVKQTGSLRNALAAYNAGPGNLGAGLGYADKVLALAKGYQGIKSPAPAHGSGATAKTTTVTTTTPAVGASSVPGSAESSGLDALVAAMSAAQRPVAPLSQPVAPSFSAAPRFASGFTPSRSLSAAPFALTGQSSLAQALAQVASTPAAATTVAGTAQPKTSTTTVAKGSGSMGSGSGSTAAAPGGVLPKNHSQLFELIHNTGSGPGFGVKNGQVVNGSQVFSGVWAGHRGHVHVAAGPDTVVVLGKLAQSMGLHVGENPHFGGVNPVHVPGSYHYKGEAIDVSGSDQAMNAYARRVEQLFGLKSK